MTNKQTRNRTQQRNIHSVIKSIMETNLEHQVVNYNIGATTYSTSGSSDAITQSIVQGSSLSQRDGSQLTLKEMTFRQVDNLTTATVGAAVRTLIVLDTQNTGVNPSITDVLDNASVQSPYNVNNRMNNRFVILYDKIQGMALNSSTQEISTSFRRKMNVRVSYNGTTNAPGSNGRNAMYVFHITDLGTAGPTYKFSVSLRYTDA